MKNLAAMTTLTERQRGLIHPPPRLSISGWAERFAYIPKEGNAEPGKYHLSRMPWQKAMLDDPFDPAVQEIAWMMASQYSGKTLCFSLITEYRIKVQAASTIVVYPTIDSSKKWFKKKLEPMTKATPCMDGLLLDTRKRDANSTALDRAFPGGSLTMLGANSPSAFRGTTADGVLQDEIDAYEDGDEGDPCSLADRAAETFSNPVKLKASTPKLEGFSRISALYEKGDKQKYFVPCPCCGHMQHLLTERMKFSFTDEEYERFKNDRPDVKSENTKAAKVNDADVKAGFNAVNQFQWTIGDFKIIDTAKAIYVCEKCEKGWTDTQRIAAIMSGSEENPAIRFKIPKGIEGVLLPGPELYTFARAEWQATAPFTGIRSRHLNGMYAVIGLKQGFDSFLHMFAEKFLSAKRGGRAKFQVWVNTFKTEPFEDASEKVDWKELFDSREEYSSNPLPDPVMMVVAMVDNQKDRVEVTTMGWGPEQECWLLDYKVIYGDLDMPEMRERVGDYLTNKRFTHRILGEMPLRMAVLDSGFQKSPKVKAVYRFCKQHANRDFFAIRGVGNIEGAVYTVRVERAFQIKVFNFNVDYLKNIVIGHLQNRAKAGKDVTHPNSIHFPIHPDFDEKYFIGVCSEKKVTVNLPNGGKKQMWKKITSNVRNEPWDLIVYGFGAFEILRKAGEVERIERKWLEVKKKLNLAEPTPAPTIKTAVDVMEAEPRPPQLKAAPRQQSPFQRVAQPSWRRWAK